MNPVTVTQGGAQKLDTDLNPGLVAQAKKEAAEEKAEAAKEKTEAKDKAASELESAQQVNNSGLPEFLTPQSLVAYCDCRLTSLDSQMQSIFNQQQTAATTTNAISQVADDLNDLPAPNNGTPPMISVTPKQVNQTIGDYWSAIHAAGAKGSNNAQLVASLKADLLTFENQFRGGMPAQTTCSKHMSFGSTTSVDVPASVITNLSQNLKTDGSDLNNDSQMSMINLQSLMSQQQTAVELSTNLLQTLSQTSQNIASNMKAG